MFPDPARCAPELVARSAAAVESGQPKVGPLPPAANCGSRGRTASRARL